MLARARHAATAASRRRWLDAFAASTWIAKNLGQDRSFEVAAAVHEHIRALQATVEDPPEDDEDDVAAIDIWFHRVCDGMSVSEIAHSFRRSTAWVNERCGLPRCTLGAWAGVAAVKLAAETALQEISGQGESDSALASTKYALATLDPPSRALAGFCITFAPTIDFWPTLLLMEKGWHASYFKVLPVLRDHRQLQAALTSLGARGIVTRRTNGTFVPPNVHGALRSLLPRDEQEEAVGDAMSVLLDRLGEDPDPRYGWKAWDSHVLHVEHAALLAAELKSDEKYAVALLDSLGRYYSERSDFDHALRLSGKAISLARPALPDDKEGLARLLINRGQQLNFADKSKTALRAFDEAISLLARHSRGGYRHADAIGMRANVYHAVGETGKAVAGYRKAIRMLQALEDVDEDLAEVYNDYAGCLVSEGRPKLALKYYYRALELADEEESLGRIRCNLGDLLIELGEPRKAISVLETAVPLVGEAEPKVARWRWRLLLTLATACEKAGEVERAQRLRDEAVAINQRFRHRSAEQRAD
jgi:tetratricopeptide (TPR) repeat protein